MSLHSRLAGLLRCIRWADVLILQGAPILGIAFSIGPSAAVQRTASLFFGVASFLLVNHIFTFNDWAESIEAERENDPAVSQIKPGDISPRALFAFSFALLFASLLFFLFWSPRLFFLAAAIAASGIFYSHPSLNAKSMPIISTLLHLVGGVLHFLLGYALFSTIDRRGVLIGLFLGLTFAAGHPIQEIRDLDEDRRVGTKTNAVVFGQRATFFAGLILFTVEYMYLFWLAWSGLIPRFLVVLPVVFYPIHISWSVAPLRNGLTSTSITKFENRYRILYVLIGLALLLSTLTWNS